MNHDSTICAISTAPGNGAIAIIRLTGKEALSIADKLFVSRGKEKKLIDQEANTIHFGNLKDGDEIIDEVLVSLFRNPYSYTGEDLIEVACHGSEYIQEKVLQLFTRHGARMAGPGEFTMRAFLNGKMDLSQAEAVADLIASDSKASHRIAMDQMKGGFSREIAGLREKLLNFISLIELELDFSEEDVEFADRAELSLLIAEIRKLIRSLVDSFKTGNVIKNGIPVAIAGKTNVGKSTLLNVLLNEDRAIVSDIAGTTRDTIEDVITIDGFRFRFIDTAGLRKTKDSIETIGIEKTFEKIDQAFVILYMIDVTESLDEINRLIAKIKKRIGSEDKKLVVLLNKVDFLSDSELKRRQSIENYSHLSKKDTLLLISAKKRINTDQISTVLASTIRKRSSDDHNVIITNVRHYEALSKAGDAIDRVVIGLETALPSDLMAIDIREVLHYLGEITGQVTTDEVLGNIFKNFCIGK